MEAAQLISVLAVAAPKDESETTKSSVKDFVNVVGYETIALALRQFGKSNVSQVHSAGATQTSRAITAMTAVEGV